MALVEAGLCGGMSFARSDAKQPGIPIESSR